MGREAVCSCSRLHSGEFFDDEQPDSIQERRDSPIAIAVALRKISTQTAKDSNVRMLWLKIRVQQGEDLDERMTKVCELFKDLR
jgi:hypothetical protein